jgi:hypothetical protein
MAGWCRAVGYIGISFVARADYHRGVAEAQRALDRAREGWSSMSVAS